MSRYSHTVRPTQNKRSKPVKYNAKGTFSRKGDTVTFTPSIPHTYEEGRIGNAFYTRVGRYAQITYFMGTAYIKNALKKKPRWQVFSATDDRGRKIAKDLCRQFNKAKPKLKRAKS